MNRGEGPDLDMQYVLRTVGAVLDRLTVDTEIGKIVMPGPTYLGMWARDTGIVALGLNRLGKLDLSRELLRRYWGFQITEESDPATFIFRNKTCAAWTDDDVFHPTRSQLMAEVGAFPTSVYIRTPDFPPGTREIYTDRADLDSVAWMIIALRDLYVHSGDDGLLHELAPSVSRAIGYLCTRDEDGDHLLEQGPNADWADILLRHGKVAYTQAVWYRCLDAAEEIFTVAGDPQRAAACRREREAVRCAVNRMLLTPRGYYANYVSHGEVSLRRSLDTALLVAFGVAGEKQARSVLDTLSGLRGPFGYAVIEPGYDPHAIGPSKYPPGQYQNEGIWPWITSYLALAWAAVGERERAHEVICSIFGEEPDTTHEWIDNVSGEPHHAEFATAAGAIAWAITEAGLAG